MAFIQRHVNSIKSSLLQYRGSRSNAEPNSYLSEFIDVPKRGKDNKHVCSRDGCNRVVLNVSGAKFETTERTLARVPNSLLGNPERRQKYWDPKRNEYFFDRHRPSFEAILFFYQSGGILERPIEVPPDVFITELKFFEFSKSMLRKYLEIEGVIYEADDSLPSDSFKRMVWKALEVPSSSIYAKILSMVSISAIFLSISSFCAETLPAMQKKYGCTKDNRAVLAPTVQTHNPFFILESICMTWFSIEFSCRFFSCPSKLKFIQGVLNWIDLLAIIPFYVYLGAIIGSTKEMSCQIGKSTIFLGTFRMLRLVRIFTLTRHFYSIRVILKTFASSGKEFVMFGMFFSTAVILFSSTLYFIEHSSNSEMFPSIPATFYFTIITMTTVGYGDIYPKTTFGKIFGAICVVSGVIAIAIPIPIIVSKFTKYYLIAKRQEMFQLDIK